MVGPGRLRPARLLLAALLVVPPAALPAQGRVAGQGAPAAAPAAMRVPDRRLGLPMVRSILAAVDHANRTGNYSVLRDLATPAFQARNNPATLGAIFAGLRESGTDMSDILVVAPTWDFEPRMVGPRVVRMRGAFPLQPSAVLFDLLFSWEGDGWRLEGIAVQAAPAGQ